MDPLDSTAAALQPCDVYERTKRSTREAFISRRRAVFSRLTETARAAKIDVMNNPQIGGSEA